MEKELFDMKTDIQIAQEATLLPISQVAAAAGIDEDLLEHYGKVKAKIDIRPLRDNPRKVHTVTPASASGISVIPQATASLA